MARSFNFDNTDNSYVSEFRIYIILLELVMTLSAKNLNPVSSISGFSEKLNKFNLS